MNRRSQRDAVDLLTLVLSFILLMFIGWWGVLAAFVIGFIINAWYDHTHAIPEPNQSEME